MTENEATNVINTALSGKHRNFEYIYNRKQALMAEEIVDSLESLVNRFKKLKKGLCRELKKTDEFFSVNYKEMVHEAGVVDKCLNFYKDEISIINGALKEYRKQIFGSINAFIAHLNYEDRSDAEDLREVEKQINGLAEGAQNDESPFEEFN